MFKHHKNISEEYRQDWINGITEAEYKALLSEVEKILGKIIEVGGGTGELTLRLQKLGRDVVLTDLDDSLLAVARGKGVQKTKVFDITAQGNSSIGTAFNVAISKSVEHEFPKNILPSVHKNVFSLLKEAGVYFDWDVHVETDDQAKWLLEYVNQKDSLSGDVHLVKNRCIYTTNEVSSSLHDAGFKDVEVVHNFKYIISNKKFAKAYFSENGKVDKRRSEKLYEIALSFLDKTPPGVMGHHDTANREVIFEVPAAIIKAQK